MSLLNHPSAQATGLTNAPRVWDYSESSAPKSNQYAPSMWVHLFQPPTDFSFDEALLLCQQDDDDTWVVWIPGYGEMTLKETEFVPLA